MNDAPASWRPLGEIAEVVGGVTKDSKRQSDSSFVEVPYLRVANVQRGYLNLDTVTTIRVPAVTVDKLRLEPGDILFNEGGDRDKLGRGWVWEGQVKDCIHQNHVFRARLLSNEFDPKFVSFHGNTFGRTWFEKMGKQTTNLASLSLTTLKAFPVPDVPVERQRAIVAAIEDLLSRLDAGVAALGRARRNLLKLRTATFGQLVGFSRGAELPEGWRWATIAEVAANCSAPVLTGPFGTSLSRADFRKTGIPVLTIGSLTPDGIRLDLAPRVSEAKARTLERYALDVGDVLFSRMATVGRAAVVCESEAGALINYHLMRLRLDSSAILPDYLVLLCQASGAIRQFLRDVNHGVTRPGINTRQLLSLPVALPPLGVQQKIVSSAQFLGEAIANLDREVGRAATRSLRLRSSILTAALNGKLVAPEPG